jgi:probable HAF family extracellular repeat protein
VKHDALANRSAHDELRRSNPVTRIVVSALITTCVLAGLLSGGIGTAGATREPRTYTVTDLGTFGGVAAAFGVNDRGQVVGCSAITGSTCGHAFLFDRGRLLDLGTLPGGEYSVANAINNRGQVVGVSGLAGRNPGLPFGHAFLFSRGRMQDLGTLGGSWSQAFDINARGDVVGGAYVAGDVTQHAFLYRKGQMVDINPAGRNLSVAFGINDSGTVVGVADGQAFAFKRGQTIFLGTLGGSGSEARAINTRSEIVGTANLPGDTALHAFLYRRGQMIDLGTLGGLLSLAEAINARGQIVGVSETSFDPPDIGGPLHAFLYERGQMLDLNDFLPANSGWELRWATGINNRGQIVGFGTHDGAERAFLLTPHKDDDDDD